MGFDRVGVDPLLDDVIADGLGAVFGELLVVVVPTDAVGVSFDCEMKTGIGEDDSGDFCQAFAGSGKKLEAAAAEQDVGHVGDQAAGGVAGGKNAVELL